MMLDRVYIHTSGRWRDPLVTVEALSKAQREITTLVVQHREAKHYEHYLDRVGLWVLPKKITRLSPTRQYIADETPGQYIAMLDDDILNFGYRRDPADWKLKPATDKEINWMFSWCAKQLRKFAHCGPSPRNQNHTFKGDVKTAGRMTTMLCYDVAVLRKQKFRFDRLATMSDFDMTLQLLIAGFPNVILFKGCTKVRSVPTRASVIHSGGCAAYRTPAMQTSSAKKLAKLHAPFVKLREKKAGIWAEDPVTDVTVYWKKAYESSQR